MLLVPEVESGSIRQPISGGVSLWEFWLLESGVLEGKSQMQDCMFQACMLTFPIPRVYSLVCNLQVHVHIEPLCGREAGYHRTEAVCQPSTMEACT